MTDARSKLYRTIALHALMISLAALFLLPFVWLVVTSLKNDSHIRANPGEWVPRAEYVQRPGGAWREVLRAEDHRQRRQTRQAARANQRLERPPQ